MMFRAQYAVLLLAVSLLAGCAAVKTALSPLGEIIGPDSMAEQYVSVRTVPLYSEPSGFAAVVTNVEYASKVRALQYVSKVPAVFVRAAVADVRSRCEALADFFLEARA